MITFHTVRLLSHSLGYQSLLIALGEGTGFADDFRWEDHMVFRGDGKGSVIPNRELTRDYKKLPANYQLTAKVAGGSHKKLIGPF